jgi:hypothetical protein
VEEHGSSSGRVQRAKQLEARKVDIAFEYSGGPSRGGDRNRRDNARETSQRQASQQTTASRDDQHFPAIGSETSRMQQLNLQSPERTENKDKKQTNQPKSKGMKKPEGFGSLSQNNDWPGLGQAPTSQGSSPGNTVNATTETFQKHTALLEKLQDYVNGDQKKIEQFRQLTSLYRSSNIDAKRYVDQIFQLLNSDVDQAARIIRGVEDLLDNNNKKAEIVRYWRDKRTSVSIM